MENSKERADKFLNEYKALTEKYQIDFVSFPTWVPLKDGGFVTKIQMVPFDTKEKGVVSPFSDKKPIL